MEFFPLQLCMPTRVALTSVPQCGDRRSQRQRPADSEPRGLSLRAPPPLPPAGSPGPSGAVRKARCGCAAEFRSGELQYPADRGASSGVPGNASPPRMARRFGPSAPRAGRVVPVCAPRPGGAAPAFPRSASLGAGRAEAAAGPWRRWRHQASGKARAARAPRMRPAVAGRAAPRAPNVCRLLGRRARGFYARDAGVALRKNMGLLRTILCQVKAARTRRAFRKPLGRASKSGEGI